MSFAKQLKASVADLWEQGYTHPFVQELGQGILPKETFQFYLIQDYHYLFNYAKVFALATVKADEEQLMKKFTSIQHNILHEELSIHRSYMETFGISLQQAAATKQALFNRTYTANMLAIGQTGDLAEILATVFPCAWTYGDYAQRLKKDYPMLLANNFYLPWIEGYASEDYQQSYEWFFDTLDALCLSKTEIQRGKIQTIFQSSVEFEYLFWDMSYKQKMSF